MIIDVTAMGGDEDAARGYYKALGDPPADGIADDNVALEKDRRKSDAAVATVLSGRMSGGADGWQQRMMREPQLDARFGAEFEASRKRR